MEKMGKNYENAAVHGRVKWTFEREKESQDTHTVY